MIVMAHYNLGDWEFGLKAVRDTPNIYPSTGGSGLAAGYIEAGVREVGTERIIFGSDNSICGGMAKICNVDISGRGMLGATVHLGIADMLDWHAM